MEGGSSEDAANAATTAGQTPAPAPAPAVTRTAAPSTSFEGCRPTLSHEVLEVVKAMGFKSMTPVQVGKSKRFVVCGV